VENWEDQSLDFPNPQTDQHPLLHGPSNSLVVENLKFSSTATVTEKEHSLGKLGRDDCSAAGVGRTRT